MDLLIVNMIGVIVGSIVTQIILRIKSVGTMRIDTSDPEDGPYLFLELTKDVLYVKRKKYITLKVSSKNYISSK